VNTFPVTIDTVLKLLRQLPPRERLRVVVEVLTVAELYQWAYSRNWGEQRLARLEERLRAYVVVPYDGELCKQWAMIGVVGANQYVSRV